MKPTDNSLSRREFAKRAALGTAAIVAPVPLSPLAESAQLPAEAAKLSPPSQAEAQARYQAILAQYPDRFSDAQKTDLKRLCFVAQEPLDKLRAWSVANADQPALYLKPLVEREKKTNAPPNLKLPAPSPGDKLAPSPGDKPAAPPAGKPAPAPAKPSGKPAPKKP